MEQDDRRVERREVVRVGAIDIGVDGHDVTRICRDVVYIARQGPGGYRMFVRRMGNVLGDRVERFLIGLNRQS